MVFIRGVIKEKFKIIFPAKPTSIGGKNYIFPAEKVY